MAFSKTTLVAVFAAAVLAHGAAATNATNATNATTAAAVNTTAAAAVTTAAAAAVTTTAAAAAVTTTAAAAAVPGEEPKTITKQVVVLVQTVALKLPMPRADCTAITSSKADTKKNAEATAAAAGMDASSVDFERSSVKCKESRRAARGRRQTVSLEVTLVFKEGVSKDAVAQAAAKVNVMIQKPGGLQVTVSIGGVEKKIAVTETVSQKTETITVTKQVPNPAYTVPSGNGTTTAKTGTTTNALNGTTTAKTGTTTNALSTPKASASLARGSALLVAALAASHALLA